MISLTLQPWELRQVPTARELHREPHGWPLQLAMPHRDYEDFPVPRRDASSREWMCCNEDFGDSPRDHVLAQLSRAGCSEPSQPPPQPPRTAGSPRTSPPPAAAGCRSAAPAGRRGGGRRGRQPQAKDDVQPAAAPLETAPSRPAPQAAAAADAVRATPSSSRERPAPPPARPAPPPPPTLLPGAEASEEAEQLLAVTGPWPEDATTVMLRNIPNRYTAEELLAEMIAAGFEGSFDFFYLPIDFKTKRNRGYSFINFLSAELAAQFVRSFSRERLTRYTTQKILEVTPAVTQGFQANVARYVRKDAQRIKNAWFRPMIFGAGSGAGSGDDSGGGGAGSGEVSPREEE